jgi:hypothetical protein
MIERSMSLMNMSWLFYILNDKDPTPAFYSARKDEYDYVDKQLVQGNGEYSVECRHEPKGRLSTCSDISLNRPRIYTSCNHNYIKPWAPTLSYLSLSLVPLAAGGMSMVWI